MRHSTVARSYAEALFELGLSDGALEDYDRALHDLVDWVLSERDFRVFLETPRISSADKKATLEEALGGRVPNRVLRFLFVVIDKGRQRLLPAIADEYGSLVDQHHGRVEVSVTTALEPDDRLKRELKERLAAMLEKEVVPRYRVDPRLVGGVIVRVGDRVMDGSLRRRLQSLRRRLLAGDSKSWEAA